MYTVQTEYNFVTRVYADLTCITFYTQIELHYRTLFKLCSVKLFFPHVFGGNLLKFCQIPDASGTVPLQGLFCKKCAVARIELVD